MSASSSKLLVLFTCFTLSLSAITEDRVIKGPFRFTVHRQVDSTSRTDNQTFDILVEPLLKASRFPSIRKWHNHIAGKHSSRNVQIGHATSSSKHFHSFPAVTVEENGLFSVRIQHHSSNGDEITPSYNIQLHFSAKSLTCPVVLQQDTPSARRGVLRSDLMERTKMRQEEEPGIESQKQGPLNDPNFETRIVGGLFASPNLKPFLVSLTQACPPGTLRCSQNCTGTLVSSRWVMTAAHCRMRIGARAHIAAGLAGTGSFRTVNQSIPHPRFESDPDDSRSEFDIAVLELDGDATDCPGCDVQPRFMTINFDSELPEVDAFARVAGYGQTAGDGPDRAPGRLRQVDVPNIDIATCSEVYNPTVISGERQLCAGYLVGGGCDSCIGDTGGPLVQYSGDTPVLTGITSFGIECANARFPGVYTRPAGHRAWLESTGAEFTENMGPLEQVRMACEVGEVLEFAAGTGAACQPCSHRDVSPGGVVSACSRCPSNLRRDPDDGSSCSCSSQPGRGFRRRRCRRCRRGTASPIGDNRCRSCPPDTFARGRGSERCSPCLGAPAGSSTCSR